MRLSIFFIYLLLAVNTAHADDRYVYIQTNNGINFFRAEGGGGGGLNATSVVSQTHELFRIVDLNGGALMSCDRVCFETHNGHFMVAESGGGREVNANRRACGPWETFRIVRLSGPAGWPIDGEIGRGTPTYVSIQAPDGRSWVVAEGGGGGAVNANRPAIGPWERFALRNRF